MSSGGLKINANAGSTSSCLNVIHINFSGATLVQDHVFHTVTNKVNDMVNDVDNGKLPFDVVSVPPYSYKVSATMS